MRSLYVGRYVYIYAWVSAKPHMLILKKLKLVCTLCDNANNIMWVRHNEQNEEYRIFLAANFYVPIRITDKQLI